MTADAEETALKAAWEFLEHWTQRLSEPEAASRLPAFLAAAASLPQHIQVPGQA